MASAKVTNFGKPTRARPTFAFARHPYASGWPDPVRSAFIHVISLAHYAIVAAGGWSANAVNPRARHREGCGPHYSGPYRDHLGHYSCTAKLFAGG